MGRWGVSPVTLPLVRDSIITLPYGKYPKAWDVLVVTLFSVRQVGAAAFHPCEEPTVYTIETAVTGGV